MVGDRFLIVNSKTGGAAVYVPADVVDGQLVVSIGGLLLTTAGVTPSGNNQFVSQQQLNDLTTLQPLAALEAVLAAVGARTGAETLLASIAGVDLNAAPATPLYTVPAGKTAVITKIVLRNASASLTTASISFGFTGAAYNDVIATTTHTELTGPTLFTVLVPKIGAKLGVAAAVLNVIANILQGGAATVTIDVFGYLF